MSAPDVNGDEMAENDVAAQAASARQYDWRPRPDPTLLTTMQLRETEVALNRTITEKIDGLRELLEQRLGGMDRATVLLAERIEAITPENMHGRDVLRGEIAAAILNLRELIEARIDAIDRATKLLAADVAKTPTDITTQTGHVREFVLSQITLATAETQRVGDVAEEKFKAIEGLFASNALALAAALAAAEKAVEKQNESNTVAISKSEVATKETINANAAQTQTGLQALADTFADIKERIVRLEAGGVGRSEQRGEQRSDNTYTQMERISASDRIRSQITVGVSIIAVLVSITVAITLITHH
jgi:hypothetical protein